jgi:ArsR family transcriptional regulator
MYVVNIPPESVFQALADQTRIRILRLLAVTGDEACLCELSECLNEPDYKLSRHVKVLRQSGLLSSEKEGRWVYFKIIDRVRHIDSLYRTIRDLPDPERAFLSDLKAFKKVRSKQMGIRCGSATVPRKQGVQRIAVRGTV